MPVTRKAQSAETAEDDRAPHDVVLSPRLSLPCDEGRRCFARRARARGALRDGHIGSARSTSAPTGRQREDPTLIGRDVCRGWAAGML